MAFHWNLKFLAETLQAFRLPPKYHLTGKTSQHILKIVTQ